MMAKTKTLWVKAEMNGILNAGQNASICVQSRISPKPQTPGKARAGDIDKLGVYRRKLIEQ